MTDFDRSGNLDFMEFKKLWPKIMEWKHCFETFDQDRSSTIDRKELMQVLNQLDVQLNSETIDLVVARYVNKRGTINLDDFIQVCARLTSIVDSYWRFQRNDLTFEEMMMGSLYN